MSGAHAPVWVIVLVKDFGDAKHRLRTALQPEQRQELARENARKALAAAAAGDRLLAVCGSKRAAELARQAGAEVLQEVSPSGQNPAARLGLAYAVSRGAGAVLLLSSDLPLINRSTIAGMLASAGRLAPPAVVAAPATGRGGTNALYLCPPDAIDLHFGNESLVEFERDAVARGARFQLYRSPRLALDLDEPADLAELRRQEVSGQGLCMADATGSLLS
ncbi:MAG TPA: 2-phospho-L-lactate guanylyltransferase [Candidatus Dormibacteraeota bacterium]|nr:2-phospho-L-lactate guanylyltransferase [Candidatus Dormibacteraeota bacterium]